MFGKISGLAALGLLVCTPASAYPSNFTRRTMTTGDLSNYRGALFVVASTQTSCEMALIDSSAGFIPASCLSYKSNGNVDNSIDYRVAVADINGKSTAIHSVTMVDAHPQYNPKTYANNIAVLHWGDPYDINWHQYIAQDKPDWDNVFYTRRTMSSVSKKSWNTPATLSLSGTAAPSGCSSASNLYKSNEDWFLCMAQTTTSIVNKNCQTPFGAAWAVYQPNNMAVAALYSHSAIYGGSELCGSTGNQYHYYTLLQPYADWAAKMTGRKVYSYAADSSYSYDGSSSFKMSNDLAPDVFGVKQVSGDVYPYAKDYSGPGGTASNNGETAGSNPPPASTPKPTPTPTPTSKPDTQSTTSNKPQQTTTNRPQPTNDNDNDNDNDNNNDNEDNNDDDKETTEEQKSSDKTSQTSSDRNSSSSSKSSSDSEESEESEESDESSDEDSDESSDESSEDSEESEDNNVVGGNSNNSGSKDKDGSKKEENNGSSGDSSGGDSAAASNESRSGLSRGATIAVATVVPIITIAIIVALFFVYRWWRRRQNALSWDPKNESANIDRRGIMDEFEGMGVDTAQRNSTPPSYDDHGFQGNLEADSKPPV
ncbi:hypothetical protein LPJ78_001938 [Coemansia sp. RSA 989]|nr:hypothetical protein BX667DRAFT_501063 [Coemansia mojavensis]KAJ1739019.1 hypothetical protein LPJ68_005046 [Coemansia sp. RSA 1086]KAJ1751078.1 hypothetical protein LPJ79_002355 [Coemansia sp. RSA 1821]KAJ1866281.1 hypothetical protein LPJ78_001938 [Coemansia sp. RSA 989]KAJ1872451.1 hypothetical protein LPJ55_003069 [Coemansia sp. RSA 990]KAJ2653059.1 hypothetical protein IWW40_000713 [Coemansia sp. RSA 1250]KAJ2676059.1 hypothetical protein IWW42_000728 [Coemansia sp. RSA 1085]